MFLPNDITLKPGDSSDYVRELQRRLMQRDLLGETNLTGHYDGTTTQAVMEFQTINGLRSDGVAGPETLRRLISIGAGEEGSAGGGSASNEEEKDAYVNPELHDEYALAEEQQQRKLANEAVWGYGEETSAERSTTSQHQEQEAEQIEQVDRTQSIAQERLDQQRLHTHELDELSTPQPDEQLQINQQGIQAQTIADDLNKTPDQHHPPLHDRETQSALEEGQPQPTMEQSQTPTGERPVFGQKSPEAEAALATSSAPIAPEPPALHDAPEPDPSSVPALTPSRDAALERTEAQLAPPSREESNLEGRKLDREGVENNGPVSERELGELSPDRSPAVQREQEIARS